MNLKDNLITLGLNDNEVAVYLALLPLGTVPASVLGMRVGIPRSTAKYTCQQLVKKGVVIESGKNNTEYYTAKSPESLLIVLEEQQKELSRKKDGLERIMGDLKMMYRSDIALPKVQFFEGRQGIIKLFEDVLSEQKPLYGALDFDDQTDPEIRAYLDETYVPRRKRLRFPAWMLFNDNEQTRAYQKNDHEMNRISLLLPEKKYPFYICFHIYGDKVAFYSYRSSSLSGVLIQDTFIQKMQFSLFRMAWDLARTLPVNEQYRKVEVVE